jgi:hypothetical protein
VHRALTSNASDRLELQLMRIEAAQRRQGRAMWALVALVAVLVVVFLARG